MRKFGGWFVMSLLLSASLSACAMSERGPQSPVVALDQLVPAALISVAEDHLKALGFDPGPVDGVFTAETAEALRQYQRRYGLVVSGLLDSYTRITLGLEKCPGEM